MNIFQRIFSTKFSALHGELYSYIHSLTGVRPKNIHLYTQALTHRSVSTQSNERLEYLGDALIGFVVAEQLFRLYPDAEEGFLTRARAKAVCRDNLNLVAHRLHIDQHLNTALSLKNNTENIFGNALEALVGALYLDAGFQKAADFVIRNIAGENNYLLLTLAQEETDFKSALLQYAQAQHKKVQFLLIREYYLPQEDRHRFLYQVHIDGQNIAQADGYSKHRAQQTAAEIALNKLQNNKTLQNNKLQNNKPKTNTAKHNPTNC